MERIDLGTVDWKITIQRQVLYFFYTQAWLKSVQKFLQQIIIAHRAAKKDPTYHKNNRKILKIVTFFLAVLLSAACVQYYYVLYRVWDIKAISLYECR